MRRIGTINSQADANRFGAFLLSQGIGSRIDCLQEQCAVWVYEEDQVPAARERLEEFLADPADPRYQAAVDALWHEREESLDRRLAERMARIPRRAPVEDYPLSATPVTFGLIVLCGMVFAAMQLGHDRTVKEWLLLSQWMTTSGTLKTFLTEVRAGEFWRLLSPALLHFGLLHLFMNMAWLYLLGRMLEVNLGPWRYTALLVLLATVSNLAQGLFVGPNFGGMSCVVCGLFGYVWCKAHLAREPGYVLAPDSAVFFIGWLLFCLTGLAGPIANTAHFSGLALGVLLALPRTSTHRSMVDS